jgi:hypothetical protein
MLEEFPTCNAEYDPAVRQPGVYSASGVGFNEVSEHAWLYSPAGDPLKFLSEDELLAYKRQIDNNVVNGYAEGDFDEDFPALISRTMRKRSKATSKKSLQTKHKHVGKTKKPQTKASAITTKTTKTIALQSVGKRRTSASDNVVRTNQIIELLD